ncbi:MAG: hypothetical protein AVDCRST_MAG78-2642, partial [uncultured Rubrobacteraceae bacterium]
EGGTRTPDRADDEDPRREAGRVIRERPGPLDAEV